MCQGCFHRGKNESSKGIEDINSHRLNHKPWRQEQEKEQETEQEKEQEKEQRARAKEK